MRRIWAVVAALCLLTGCGEPAEKKEFMRSCLASGGDDAVCDCTYDRIAQTYGKHWGGQDELQAEQGFSTQVSRALMLCIQDGR